MNEPALRTEWAVEQRQWQGARPYQEARCGCVDVELGRAGETPAVLMVLADGMGGEAGGAIASCCVVEAFLHHFREVEGEAERKLDRCLDIANREVMAHVDADPDMEGMGSTVVAAVYDGRSVRWLSAGDSPMWLFTGGRLERLNADHSMAPVLDRMAEIGEITRDAALSDGTRHMLRSAVTGTSLDLVDRGHRRLSLETGEYLLMASDGIETLAEEEIEQCIGATHGGASAAASALLSAVKAAARPHQDNVTFLLLAGKGSATQPIGLPVQATEKAARPFWQVAHRSAVAALFLGAALLLGSLIWWALGDSQENEPDLEETAMPDSSAKPAQGDSRSQPDDSNEEGTTPGSTGEDEPAARPDRSTPESDAPAAGQTLKSSPSPPGPRPKESPHGTASDSPETDAAPRAPAGEPESGRLDTERSGQ